MYLIRNKRTKDFIDNSGDWTLIRSFAKRFASKDEAQKFIDKHQTKNDDPYMEIISESTQKRFKEYFVESKMKSFKHFLSEATISDKYKPYLLKNAKVGDVFLDAKDAMREYKITKVTPSKVYATCVKYPNTTAEYNRLSSEYNETDPQYTHFFTVK